MLEAIESFVLGSSTFSPHKTPQNEAEDINELIQINALINEFIYWLNDKKEI